METRKPNPYNDNEWRETRTSLTPDQLNDAQTAITMIPKGMTFCELVNANKRVLEAKRVGVPEAQVEYRGNILHYLWYTWSISWLQTR